MKKKRDYYCQNILTIKFIFGIFCVFAIGNNFSIAHADSVFKLSAGINQSLLTGKGADYEKQYQDYFLGIETNSKILSLKLLYHGFKDAEQSTQVKRYGSHEAYISQGVFNPSDGTTFDARLRPGITIPIADKRLKRTLYENQGIEEASIKIGIGGNFKFTAGRFKNDWGLFGALSPSLALLPQKQSVGILQPDKNNLLVAQDQWQIGFGSGIFSMHIIHFGEMRTDNIFEANELDRLSTGIVGVHSDEIRFRKAGEEIQTTDENPIVRVRVGIPRTSPEQYNTTAKAFRVTVKPFWGKFSFTRYNGRDASKALLDSSKGIELFNTPTVAGNASFATEPYEVDGEKRLYLLYPKAQMDAFQIEVPQGKKMTWHFETALYNTIEGLGDNGKIYANIPRSLIFPPDGPSAFTTIRDRINDTARSNDVRGRFWYQAVQRSLAGSMNYQGERYQTHIGFVQNKESAPINETEALVRYTYESLIKQAFQNHYLIPNKQTNKTILSFKLVRNLGDEKRHKIGLISGLISSGEGYGVLYSYDFGKKISDRLVLSIFAGKATLGTNGTNDYYKNANEDKETSIIQTNINLSF